MSQELSQISSVETDLVLGILGEFRGYRVSLSVQNTNSISNSMLWPKAQRSGKMGDT